MIAPNSQTTQNIVTLIVVLAGAFGLYKVRKPSQDTKKRLDTLEGLVNDYEKKFSVLEQQAKTDAQLHMENAKSIADLQGQIKVYKELPLRELADGIKKIAVGNEKLAAGNEKILKYLKTGKLAVVQG